MPVWRTFLRPFSTLFRNVSSSAYCAHKSRSVQTQLDYIHRQPHATRMGTEKHLQHSVGAGKIEVASDKALSVNNKADTGSGYPVHWGNKDTNEFCAMFLRYSTQAQTKSTAVTHSPSRISCDSVRKSLPTRLDVATISSMHVRQNKYE